MRRYLILLFILFGAFLLVPGNIYAISLFSDTSSIDLTASVDKISYNYQEQIDIQLEASNTSEEDISVSFDDGCQMGFTITMKNTGIGGYTVPIYNNELFPRNCSRDQTEVIIPAGKKAVWTRTFTGSESLPDLLPGEYLLHVFIVGFEQNEMSYDEDTYIKFSVNYSDDGKLGGACAGTAEIECESNMFCQVDGAFEDGGVCVEDEILPDPYNGFGNLCKSTGGDFDPCASPCDETSDTCIQLCLAECTCPANYEWSDDTGCTHSKYISELCAETDGVYIDSANSLCICEENERWDASKGCIEGVIVAFNDIEGHWGEDYIKDLQSKGVIEGYDDGGFHPNDPINRVEFLKMSLSGAQKEINSNVAVEDLPFNDVEGWQVPWVTAAFNNGIVQGYDEVTFAPGNNVTRAEALKIAMLTFDQTIDNTENEWAFEDTKEHWALTYINAAYLNFLISGRDDGLVYPNDPITRAEASKIVSLLIEKN
jgi:hypothetical protein